MQLTHGFNRYGPNEILMDYDAYDLTTSGTLTTGSSDPAGIPETASSGRNPVPMGFVLE